MKAWKTTLQLSAMTTLALAATAMADGGTVQLSKTSGPYHVTLLTSPSPPRVGTLDVSVVVNNAESGETLRDASIMLSLAPADEPDAAITRPAVTDQSPTKLFQMASFDLNRAGAWMLAANVEGPAGRTHVETIIQIGKPIPRWIDLAGWIALPLMPITMYFFRERAAARRRHS